MGLSTLFNRDPLAVRVTSNCCTTACVSGDDNQNCRDTEQIEEEVSIAQSETERVLEVKETDTTNEVEVNVAFSDPVRQYDLIVGRPLSDQTYMISEVGSADDLSTFMGRPIRIFTKTWEVGETPNYVNEINPWELFLSDPKVANKLETFKLLQGSLKLKIMVNGSPFHYGRMVVGCRPTSIDNNSVNYTPVQPLLITNYFDVGGERTINALASLYTQRPKVFLDPATNQPQLIDWPFFVGENYIDLTDFATIDRMGRLEIWELSKLKHANGSTDAVEISIFAWMTDVHFAGLTAEPPSTAQSETSTTARKKKKSKKKTPKFEGMSKEEAGEYKKDGLISGPASTIRDYANYFTEIPYIGPFAKATSIGAGAVSSIAKLFGYSRPPVLQDVQFVRPQNIGGLAYVHGADPIQKLTLDPKQELTVDPGTTGLTPDDQMSFGYIMKREAWIDVFDWQTATTQNTGMIYSILVNPTITPTFQEGGINIKCNTPISMLARPFEYWSGSLRYRFQIVASQFHRGRLLFVYEPSYINLGTVEDTNDRFAHIVDIAEERDVTFEVNWTQSEAYKLTERGMSIENGVATTEGIGLGGALADYANGKISVYVVNQLAAPTDNANVEINVFISGGDSLEFKSPRSMGSVAYARNDVAVGPPSLAQSETIMVSFAQSEAKKQESSGAIVTHQENAPEHDTMYVLNGNPTCMHAEQSDVYFGEAIVSIRSLLKRYCLHRVLATPENETGAIYCNTWDIYNVPTGPGPTYGSSNASNLTRIGAGSSPYNICAMTYIRWFMSAFIGYRGGVRWKITFFNEDMDIMSVRVVRDYKPQNSGESVSGTAVFTGGTSVNQVSQNFLQERTYRSTMSGAAVTAANVNPTLEYEIPFYSNRRYQETGFDPEGSVFVNQPELVSRRHMISYTSRHENANNFSWIETHCAIGEDFSFFFFIGAPPSMGGDALLVTPTA